MIHLFLIHMSNELLNLTYRTMQEVGYMLFGRASIFFISFINGFCTFGVTIIYFIIFGDVAKSLASTVVANGTFLAQSRAAYVVGLAGLLFYFIIKKELKDLTIASFLLALSVIVFILTFAF